jgi:hypothetical protein
MSAALHDASGATSRDASPAHSRLARWPSRTRCFVGSESPDRGGDVARGGRAGHAGDVGEGELRGDVPLGAAIGKAGPPPRAGHKRGRAARSLARENPGASSLRCAAAHRQHHFGTIRRSAARARRGRQADAVGPAGAGGSARPARRDTVVQGRGCGNSRPRQSPRGRDRRS